MSSLVFLGMAVSTAVMGLLMGLGDMDGAGPVLCISTVCAVAALATRGREEA